MYVDALRDLCDEIVAYPDERDVTERLRPSDAVILSESYPDLQTELDRYMTDVRPGYTAAVDDWFEEYTEQINTVFCERRSRRKVENGVWFNAGIDRGMRILSVRSGSKSISFPQYLERYEEDIVAAEHAADLMFRIEESDEHWTADRADDYDDWYDNVWEVLHIGDPSGLARFRSHYPDEETQALMGALQAKTETHLRSVSSHKQRDQLIQPFFGG